MDANLDNLNETSKLLSVKKIISSDISHFSHTLVLAIYSDYETMGNCLPTWKKM